MGKISASASIGVKLKRKDWSDFENMAPHASITVEQDATGTDEELLEKAEELYDKCRKLVEKKINSDIVSVKGQPVKSSN